MIPLIWLQEAAKRIAPHIRATPLSYDAENDLYIKWENKQVTGSFKARGAINKVLLLQDWERAQGLVTASAGNHGQGLALAGKIAGAQVTIFASEHASPKKVAAMRTLGADVRLVPGGYGEAEQAGLEFARRNNATWVSPYNDGQVIAGQGTLALEALEQLPPGLEVTWIVPVGGGGLISGIGSALKNQPGVAARLIGVQSEASPFFYALYHQGSQAGVEELPSLADGLAGPVEENSLTIPLTRRLAHDLRLVSEEDILAGIVYAWQKYGARIEGSAAVALAAALSGCVSDRPGVVVISGGNIQNELFEALIAKTS